MALFLGEDDFVHMLFCLFWLFVLSLVLGFFMQALWNQVTVLLLIKPLVLFS